MRMKYTDEDIEFLKKYYPIGDWDTIFHKMYGDINNKDQWDIFVNKFNK